ncbi:hypothetical protein OROMI_013911 [Orobanche minor]
MPLALDVSGDYMPWRLEAKLHLQSNKLDHVIKEESIIASEDKAKVCHNNGHNKGNSNPQNKQDGSGHRCGKEGYYFKFYRTPVEEIEKPKASHNVERNLLYGFGDSPINTPL